MRTRTEYRYDASTGIYDGEDTNTLTHRDTDFLPLPWCILIKPEPADGQIAVVNADKTGWDYKPDHSGVWYNTTDKTPVTLSAANYDTDVSGLTRLVPTATQKWNGSAWVDDLDALRAAKLAEISAAYLAERTTANKGITSATLGKIIDCRERDILNISNLVTLLEAQGVTSYFYRIKDNTDVDCTVDQIKAVLTELIAALLSMWTLKQSLIAQVNAAKTAEEISAISWAWTQS